MEFPLPQMIGRYPVESVIGRGAMGVVYLGRDPSIGRAVAIKVLDLSLAPTERAKQDFLHRFRREAQTAGRLTHPSIVTIYEAGSDPASGQPFIAMEYLTGRGLHDIIAEGALPIEKAVNILYDLVNALDHAHRQGIVHRDVKPSNILITSAGFTKIMDFGIARLEASDITHAGEFLGTPAYMSPEQAAGKTADARSDLFSLGILGYEMLTGERPFKAESVTGILAQISSHHPNPPSHLRPEIPRALDRVILKLLEKDPERRYPDGASAALELARLRPTQVIEAPPADPLATAQRAQVPAAPPAANSHAGVAIAVALGIAVGALGWLRRTPAVKPLSVSAPVPVSAPASAPAPASVPAPIPAPASSIAPSPASPPAPRTSAPAPVPPRPQPPKPVAGSGEIRLVFERPAKPGRYLVRAGDRQIASIAFAKGDTRAAKYQTVNWPAGPLTITASFDPDGGGAMQRAEKKITLEAGKSRVVSFSTGGLFRKDQLKIKD